MEVGRVDVVLGGSTAELEAAIKRSEKALGGYNETAKKASESVQKGAAKAEDAVEALAAATEKASKRTRKARTEEERAAAAAAKRTRELSARVQEAIDAEEQRARAYRQSAGAGESLAQAQNRLRTIQLQQAGATAAQVAQFERAQREVLQYEAAIAAAGKSTTGFYAIATSAAGKAAIGIGTAMAAIYATRQAIDAAIGPAMEYESSFTGVRKTVNATAEDLDALAGELRRMARDELPVGINQLNAIAQSAGQLGIQTSNIAKFTDTIARLGVSTDLGFESAAEELAQFTNITQLPQDQIDRLGATIVALGNTTATTESKILSMAMRIAGAGRVVGLADSDILSMGATLSSLGIEAEAGGSAISRLLIETASAVRTQSKELEILAETSGMAVGEFSALFQQDAVRAIDAFVEGLAEIERSGGNAFAVLEELGFEDIRLRDAILRLTNANGLLVESVDTGRRAFRENTALVKESTERFKDAEQQQQLLANKFYDVRVEIGERALPAYVDLLKATGDLVDSSGDLIATPLGSFFAGIATAASSVVGVFGGVTGAINDVIEAYNDLPDWAKTAAELAFAATRGDGAGIGATLRDAVFGPVAAAADGADVPRPGETALTGGETALGEAVAAPFRRPSSGGGAGAGGGKGGRKGATARDFLDAALQDTEMIFDAQESRLRNRLQIAREQNESASVVVELERQLLDLRKQSAEWQLRVAENTGASAGELAKLAAEYENIAESIEAGASSAKKVGDNFGRIGRTRDFSENTAGGSVLESLFSVNSPFSPGTGVLGGLMRLFGLGNAPPPGFTGPPVNAFGATSFGSGPAVGPGGGIGLMSTPSGGAASPRPVNARADFLGLLNDNSSQQPDRAQNRAEAGANFDVAQVFPTKAFAEQVPSQFRWRDEYDELVGPLDTRIEATGLLMGLSPGDSRYMLRNTLGRRAGGLSMSTEDIDRDIGRIAKAQQIDAPEAIYNLTRWFLRYQVDGEGKEFDQARYNALVEETIDLLSDDLPAGVSLAGEAMRNLEQFGDHQIVNLDALAESIADIHAAAETLASGIGDAIRNASASQNFFDLGTTLGESFANAFTDQVINDIIESEIFGESLTSSIAIFREASAAMRAGDFERAAMLQADLQTEFGSAQSLLMQEAAPIAQMLASFRSNVGLQSTPGIIRQQPIVIQNIVDGRVVSESLTTADRLNRSGGVIVPEQIGTR